MSDLFTCTLHGLWVEQWHCTALMGGFWLFFEVVDAKHCVDSIDHKYTFTMAGAPPSVNVADTVHVLHYVL